MTGDWLKKKFAPYFAACLLCLFILTWVMNLWKLDLSVPLQYPHEGDALLTKLLVKGIADNGWYLENRYLGAPGIAEWYDFPSTDTVHLLLIKFLLLFSGNYATALNLFFLLTFPLAVLAALFVFRSFGVSYIPALVASMLFAFLPCHFLRGIGHLFLGSYYLVPLTVMVALWINSERLSSAELSLRNGPAAWLRSRPARISLIVVVLTASAGVYYTFFGAFFLVVAAGLCAVRIGGLRPLWVTGVLLSVLCLTAVINLAPSLVHSYRIGRNPGTAQRHASEAEGYGMKVAQLLLPVAGHRIPVLARIRARYDAGAPLVNENSLASLGAAGSAGLLILVAAVLCQWKWRDRSGLLDALGSMALWGVLLGTVGGFGALFAHLISPQIRGYNRISVYIAFFSLFAVALVLDQCGRRWFRGGRMSVLYSAGLFFLLIAGILDQTTAGFVPRYEELKTAYRQNAQFISRIEASLPRNAMIFQMPYVKFPESPRVEGMADYEQAVGYLHGRALRWSYGSMYGRYWDSWQAHISGMPVDEMLRALAFAGFEGIYLNRFGYADHGAALEKELERALGVEPFVSGDRRVVFFAMRGFNNRLRGEYAPEEWRRASEAVLSPIGAQWGDGCSSLERDQRQNWRWCSSEGKLWLENPSHETKKVRMEMVVATGQAEPSRFRLESPLIAWEAEVGSEGQKLSRVVSVKPGRHLIRFHSDARPLIVAGDPRDLVFRIVDFGLLDAASARTRDLWGTGFSNLEKAGDLTWRWCSSRGEMSLENSSPDAVPVALDMRLATGYPEFSTLRIESRLFSEQLKINAAGQSFSRLITLPPGELKVRFSSDAKPVFATEDAPRMMLRVMNFRVREINHLVDTISMN